MDALKARMERADKVRLVAEGTDLTFSIKGIPAVKCAGEMNIPDGEVYTAPVRESAEGVITFNAPTLENGVRHENVRLVFRGGRIVEATSSNTKALNDVLDTDEGARYVGEFAIGVNPYVTRPDARHPLRRKDLRLHPLSRPAAATTTPTTATSRACIGIWCSSRRPNTAAARSGLTAS